VAVSVWKNEGYDVLAVVVNYNSSAFIGVAKMLLYSLKELSSYVKLKVLIVDNNSSDNSYEELVRYARTISLDFEGVRLSTNFGFTRAVNIAWHYARKRWFFRYFMLLNNDLVIVPHNVAKLLGFLEVSNVVGVQGTIMQASNPRIIDNAGFAVDDLGLTYAICRGHEFSCAKLSYPSYLSGALSIYKVEAVEKLGQPFSNGVECYYDDKHLGLSLWSRGAKLLHVPLLSGFHIGSASYAGRRILRSPYWFKGIVLAEVAPLYTARKNLWRLVALYYAVAAFVFSLIARSNYVGSYVVALKELKLLKSDGYIELGRVPKMRVIGVLNRVTKGIRLNKNGKA
jgi:GT2 family glycosyltransferase